MGASKAQRAATAARRDEAIKLRMARASWSAIAAQLGYADAASACKDVTRAMEQRVAQLEQTVDVKRQFDIDSLDRMQLGLWKEASTGNTQAAAEVRRIIELRGRLEGTDIAPEAEERIRAEVTAEVGAQMAVLWGRVLEGLTLSPDQEALVPELMDRAVSAFLGVPRRLKALEGEIVGEAA